MLHRLKPSILFPVLMLTLAASPAEGQCLPDNLDGGPCCGLTSAQVPLVPTFTTGTQSICWRDCGIDQVSVVKGRWKQLVTQIGLVPPPCGEQLMRLDVLSGSNALLWRGTMRLMYSRTWVAVDTNGLSFQVWRFLVNGDLTNYPAAGAAPCPVPACAASFGNRTRFTGYLDYTQDCSTPGGPSQFAWMLTHACDAIDHHAGFQRAGVFHPDRSYTFVGPSAGFVPGPIQPTEGTSFSAYESVRQRITTSVSPAMIQCTFEEPVTHTLTPQQQVCFCGAPGSSQFLIADLNVQSACGTAMRNPPSGPLLPGFVSMGLGSWTNPNVYPGQQALRWSVGGYDVIDACTGASVHHVYFGVTTLGGYQAFELVGGNPGNPLPPVFLDQASSQRPNGTPTMNTPFTSYYLMGLNH